MSMSYMPGSYTHSIPILFIPIGGYPVVTNDDQMALSKGIGALATPETPGQAAKPSAHSECPKLASFDVGPAQPFGLTPLHTFPLGPRLCCKFQCLRGGTTRNHSLGSQRPHGTPV